MTGRFVFLMMTFLSALEIKADKPQNLTRVNCRKKLLQPRQDNVIETEHINNRGNWGSMEECPNGEFAVALFVLIRRHNQAIDNQGIVGVSLKCQRIGQDPDGSANYVRSNFDFNSQTDYADITRPCYGYRGVLTGISHWAVPRAPNRNKDYVSTTQIRMYCTTLGPETELISNSYDTPPNMYILRGSERMCFEDHAIKGIQTQLDTGIGGDHTGINNIRFKCGQVDRPSRLCTARDSFEIITTCVNTGNTPKTCPYKFKFGVYAGNNWSYDIFSRFGFTWESEKILLRVKFQELASGGSANYNWRTEPDRTWNSENEVSGDYALEPNSVLTINHVIGRCDDFEIHGSRLDFRISFPRARTNFIKKRKNRNSS